MQSATKIQFSEDELICLTDVEFLLKKRRVTQKIIAAMEHLEKQYRVKLFSEFQSVYRKLPDIPGKVSRGEHYKDLPYIVLDYPRCFDQGSYFLFRSMVWWGHSVSFTLQLSGTFKQFFQEIIIQNLQRNEDNDLLIYKGDNPWDHDVNAGEYTVAIGHGKDTVFLDKPFLKLTYSFDIQMINQLTTKGEEVFSKMMQLLM